MTLNVQHTLPAMANGQPMQINIYNHPPIEKKEGGYLPGRVLYYGMELYVHSELFGGAPLYPLTYAVAFAAGTAFGLYKAYNGESKVGLEERAVAFCEGELSQRAIMIGEIVMEGPTALAVAEAIKISDRLTLGGLVASRWAFSLGADLSKYIYTTVFSEKN